MEKLTPISGPVFKRDSFYSMDIFLNEQTKLTDEAVCLCHHKRKGNDRDSVGIASQSNCFSHPAILDILFTILGYPLSSYGSSFRVFELPKWEKIHFLKNCMQ